MALFQTGSNPTCHLVPSVLNVITTCHLLTSVHVVSSKVQYLVHCFSSLSLNHHLYADDIQLFFSFYPSDLDANITLLCNALQHIFLE